MLEEPEYYLAQLALPATERAPEMRTALYLGKVLTSALLGLKAADEDYKQALDDKAVLRERLAQAEKVVQAAKGVRKIRWDDEGSCYNIDNVPAPVITLWAALAEWEGTDGQS